jgi:tetrahydromethanopterin S-methyltransferase subunit G
VNPEIDWHARDHDQLNEKLADMDRKLDSVIATLAERKGERKAGAVFGSYIIPGGVSLVVAYAVKKLGLL